MFTEMQYIPGATETMKHKGDAPVYVISVAAKLTGMPAWMLRLLDQEGIVVPCRTEKNRRLYSDNDIARLDRIRYLTVERKVNMYGVRVILEMEEALSIGRQASGFLETPDLQHPSPNTSPKETMDDLSRR
jgi:MerR family transcriptional regulator/heat shock protein HspR